jgi:hypothetical protein
MRLGGVGTAHTLTLTGNGLPFSFTPHSRAGRVRLEIGLVAVHRYMRTYGVTTVSYALPKRKLVTRIGMWYVDREGVIRALAQFGYTEKWNFIPLTAGFMLADDWVTTLVAAVVIDRSDGIIRRLGLRAGRPVLDVDGSCRGRVH